MTITKEFFYTETLSCNCPQCYGTTGLELRFQQEWKESAFSKKATDVVRAELYCKQCEDSIYPVNWTDDIERLHEYHSRRAAPSTYFKRKPLFWIVMIAVLLAIAVVIFFLLRP